jgi:hypothetical protein
MGTRMTELRDGCFARAMDDEPMFVLLARDTRASQHVRDWATQRKADISMGKKPASDMVQVDDAFATADKMDAWRTEHDGEWRNGLFGAEPNAETQDAMREAREGGLERYETVEECLDSLREEG